MVLTWQNRKDFQLHVFKDIFCLEDDSPLHQACEYEHIGDMEVLLTLLSAEIDDLTYLDDTTKAEKVIAKGDRGLVYALQAFHFQQTADGNNIDAGWTNVTQEEFDEFRVSPGYHRVHRMGYQIRQHQNWLL